MGSRVNPIKFHPSATYVALDANCVQVSKIIARDLERRQKFKALRMAMADGALSNIKRPSVRELPATRIEVPLNTGQLCWGRPDGWVAKDVRNPPPEVKIDPHPPAMSRSNTNWYKAGVDARGKPVMRKRPASTPNLPSSASMPSLLGAGSTSQSWYSGQSTASLKPKKSEYSPLVEPFVTDEPSGDLARSNGNLVVSSEEVDRVKGLMILMGSRYKLIQWKPPQKEEIKISLGPRERLDPFLLWEKSDGNAPQQWLSYRKAQAKDNLNRIRDPNHNDQLFRQTF